MLERIRRKLFLSLKIMSSGNDQSSTENNQLRSSELLDILRRGSSALADSETGGMTLQQFSDTSIDAIFEQSRALDRSRTAKQQHDVHINPSQAMVENGLDENQLLRNAEDEEKMLLSGVAQVQSRLFEGKIVTRGRPSNKEIASEWMQMQKRKHTNRLVEFNGIMHVADHVHEIRVRMNCFPAIG